MNIEGLRMDLWLMLAVVLLCFDRYLWAGFCIFMTLLPSIIRVVEKEFRQADHRK